MNDPAPKPEATASATKKDRSPSFPFITLTKAVDRTRELYVAARRHDMRLADAATAMNYAPKSSGAIQTLAALIAFGLVSDEGTGDGRKFRVTDLGFKLLEDQRPGAREAALAQAATKPKAIAEYAATWGAGRPADGICISELRIEGGFTEDGAKAFLRVFDDAIAYTKVGDSGKKPDTDGNDADDAKPPRVKVAVGDLVQAAPGGVIAFDKVRVRAVQEHNDQVYVFVEGSETGCAMSDVTLLERASPPSVAPPTLPLSTGEMKIGQGEEMDRFTVDEGVVKIAFPSGMSTDSLDDLEAFFTLFIKKAKRRAGAS